MSQIFEMELAGRKLKAEIGKVAEQANGAVILTYGAVYRYGFQKAQRRC